MSSTPPLSGVGALLWPNGVTRRYLLVIIDGLDEMSRGTRDTLVDHVSEIATSDGLTRNNHFVLTARGPAEPRGLTDADVKKLTRWSSVYEVARLTTTQQDWPVDAPSPPLSTSESKGRAVLNRVCLLPRRQHAGARSCAQNQVHGLAELSFVVPTPPHSQPSVFRACFAG